MNHLHTLRPRIIHRDLKTENLMITKYDVVKVCDFGLSQTLTKSKPFAMGFRGGTFLWQAPWSWSRAHPGRMRSRTCIPLGWYYSRGLF